MTRSYVNKQKATERVRGQENQEKNIISANVNPLQSVLISPPLFFFPFPFPFLFLFLPLCLPLLSPPSSAPTHHCLTHTIPHLTHTNPCLVHLVQPTLSTSPTSFPFLPRLFFSSTSLLFYFSSTSLLLHFSHPTLPCPTLLHLSTHN